MPNWWDEAASSKSNKYSNKYNYNDSNVEDAAEDLKDEINSDSNVLFPLFTAAGMALKGIAEKMGDSIVEVIEWRWPHE
jgi:hypothetical protein